MIYSEIEENLKQSMRARDKARLNTLRSIRAAITTLQKKSAQEQPVTDELVIRVLRQKVKQHEESIMAFEKAGEINRVQEEENELDTVKEYLPIPWTNTQLSETLASIIEREQIKGNGKKEMGMVMRAMKMYVDMGYCDNPRILALLPPLLPPST